MAATVSGVTVYARTDRGGSADVVYVLCLLQAAFLLLGGLGEVLLMGGNPLYLALPVTKIVLLLLFASRAVAGRRWGLIGLLVLQGMTVIGFWIQLVVGLVIPQVDYTVNLVGLLTNAAAPVAVIVLCARLLPARRRAMAVPADAGTLALGVRP